MRLRSGLELTAVSYRLTESASFTLGASRQLFEDYEDSVGFPEPDDVVRASLRLAL
ncbi:MAG: hypothetical protein H0W24_11560 [Lysobacter sp.]|nr:hypothetical protein [Lysobacter sp.]MDQ3206902.1 hypothetical protein [Pseudomonadota bacterium]